MILPESIKPSKESPGKNSYFLLFHLGCLKQMTEIHPRKRQTKRINRICTFFKPPTGKDVQIFITIGYIPNALNNFNRI